MASLALRPHLAPGRKFLWKSGHDLGDNRARASYHPGFIPSSGRRGFHLNLRVPQIAYAAPPRRRRLAPRNSALATSFPPSPTPLFQTPKSKISPSQGWVAAGEPTKTSAFSCPREDLDFGILNGAPHGRTTIPRSGVRSQESGVRSQGSGVRSQGSGVRSQSIAPYPIVRFSDIINPTSNISSR